MWWWVVFVALFRVSRTCEPIRVELCRGLGYNLTGMPNLVGHELQGDADFTLQTFSPLIQYGCSAQLHFFLCSVYVPMCTEKVNGPIGPCRGLCESVRARCFPVLQGFGFPWPAALNCSKFPKENNHEHMCMEGPREVSVAAIPASQISHLVLDSRPTHRQTLPCIGLAQPHLYIYMNRSGRCVQLCDTDVLFSREEKRLAGTWLSFCTVLAAACSLFGLLACIIEGGTPFSYPLRGLLYLTVCYSLAGIGWIIRLLLGRQISCQTDPSDPTTALLTQTAIAAPVKHNCAFVFLMLFYFNNSASVWWVVTAVSWFLEAGLNWSSARINHHSTLFHLAAWGLPAVQTIIVIVLRRIDADELTGTCYVGNQDTTSLLEFIIVPQLICLILVLSVLVLGLLTGLGSDNLHFRWIAVLAIFYVIPTTCVITTLLYEYMYRDEWIIAVPPSPVPVLQPRAMIWVFLLRVTMSSILGVIIGLWICLAKSKSWNNLLWSIDTRHKHHQPQQHQLTQQQFQQKQNVQQKFKPIKTSNKENVVQYYHQTPPRLHKGRKHRKYNNNGNETLV